MFKIPHLEINCIPSRLNTSKPSGVASQLASVAENEPRFDGITIEQMRGNPLYYRGDVIDKIGRAQKALADAAKVVSQPKRAKMIRALNDAAQKYQKPNTKS